jgi:hypothetical protein
MKAYGGRGVEITPYILDLRTNRGMLPDLCISHFILRNITLYSFDRLCGPQNSTERGSDQKISVPVTDLNSSLQIL